MLRNFNLNNKNQIKSKYYIDLEKNDSLRKLPVKNVVLFTNARDEKHIKEWAAHHLLIGFNYVYIFDHKSKIPLKEVFNNFDKRVIIERCELNVPPKFILMNKARNIAAIMKADWFIYLDADEFIIFNNNYMGVKQMLSRYHFADSLALNWVMFGTNNHVKEPEGLILENYTKSDLTLNQHVKTFVRPSQISLAGPTNPHNYNIVNPNRMFAITGESMMNKVFNPSNMSFDKCPAFIAHYYSQSEETYKERKILLPSDDIGSIRQEDHDIHSKHNETENLIPMKYAMNVALFLKQYE